MKTILLAGLCTSRRGDSAMESRSDTLAVLPGRWDLLMLLDDW